MVLILDGLGLEGSVLDGFAELPASTTRKEWFAITSQLIQQTIADMDLDPVVTTKRVTKQEKQQRHEWAMKKIDRASVSVNLLPLCPKHGGAHVETLAVSCPMPTKSGWMWPLGTTTSISLTCSFSASLVWSERRGRRRRQTTTPV